MLWTIVEREGGGCEWDAVWIEEYLGERRWDLRAVRRRRAVRRLFSNSLEEVLCISSCY